MKAKERYEQLTNDREQFLQRARHNAMLTIPALMPLQGHDYRAHLIEPYQSLGAAGVMSMASRMTMALVPAGRPHLRLGVPAKQLMEMDGEVPPEINRKLAKAENLVSSAAEAANWRAETLQAMQQLLVVGSVTEETLDDDTLRLHRLDNFVWRRDYRGRMLECVIREYWDVEAVPEASRTEAATNTSLDAKQNDNVEVYTLIRLMRRGDGDDFYRVERQLGNGTQVEKAKDFSPESLRYRFLRWSATPGEDYGRSKVEDIIGDLRSYESLRKQAIEIGAMTAKNFVMVRPGATANGLKNRLSRIANGDVVLGDPETVEMKQYDVSTGYQVLSDQINQLTESISQAFLLLSTQQRNAERVTATEIERDIQELESTLGGVFSTLSLELLEKRTELLIEDMKARGEFPDIEKDAIQITILTGLEALSRERDVSRGVQAGQILAQFGEEGLRRVKMDVILDKVLTGLGFPDAVKDEAQVQKELAQQQQAAMQQALVEKGTGPAIQAATKEGGGNGE